MARSRWFRWLRIGFSVVALAFIAWALKHYWHAYTAQPVAPHLRWGVLAASGAVVLATYAVLIQTWRVMLVAWDDRLTFWRAAHIWAVANLYRYVPGKVWQIGAMGMMAQREGVSPVAATGTALLNTVVNIITGFAVALATGSVALDAYSPGASRVAFALTALAVAGLLLLPVAMPRVLAMARRVTGRDLPAATVPPRVIAFAIAGNLLTWVLYGFAFQLIVVGVLGSAAGALPSYIAVYSASYVLGYIVLFLPAGIGARDGTMAAALPALKLMTGPQALLIAVSSRLWTSILELVPGFAFLAVDAWRRRSR
jgi:glycosyltransferase 2 family protein